MRNICPWVSGENPETNELPEEGRGGGVGRGEKYGRQLYMIRWVCTVEFNKDEADKC